MVRGGPKGRWLIGLPLLLSLGCSKVSSQLPTPIPLPSGQTLRIGAFPDYLARAAVQGFETRTGNKIVVETYKTNEELLERLGRGVRYDVIMPSSYAVEKLIQKGQLSMMQRERVDNLTHVPPNFRNPPYDPGLEHCVPYVWSLLGLGIVARRDNPQRDPDRWQSLFETTSSEASGPSKVVMLDDMRATIGVALRSLGRSASSRERQDLLDAQKRLLEQLPRVQDYVEDSSLPLRRGESPLVLAWSTELYDLMRKRSEVRFVLPADGTLLYVDYACVTASSTQKEVAFAFLNHLLDPFVAAETTNATMLATANQPARKLLDTEARWMWGTFDTVLSHSHNSYEILRDVGPAQPLYDEVWQTVKTALSQQKPASPATP